MPGLRSRLIGEELTVEPGGVGRRRWRPGISGWRWYMWVLRRQRGRQWLARSRRLVCPAQLAGRITLPSRLVLEELRVGGRLVSARHRPGLFLSVPPGKLFVPRMPTRPVRIRRVSRRSRRLGIGRFRVRRLPRRCCRRRGGAGRARRRAMMQGWLRVGPGRGPRFVCQGRVLPSDRRDVAGNSGEIARHITRRWATAG